MLLAGSVFGCEVQSENINFARRFDYFSSTWVRLMICWHFILPEHRSHTAAAAARISESIQRCNMRMSVQILVFYWGKTSIGANASCSKSSLVTQHMRRIVFCVANSSFFEHEFRLSNARQIISCSARGPTSRLSFWVGTEREKNINFHNEKTGPDGCKKLQCRVPDHLGGQIFPGEPFPWWALLW